MPRLEHPQRHRYDGGIRLERLAIGAADAHPGGAPGNTLHLVPVPQVRQLGGQVLCHCLQAVSAVWWWGHVGWAEACASTGRASQPRPDADLRPGAHKWPTGTVAWQRATEADATPSVKCARWPPASS